MKLCYPVTTPDCTIPMMAFSCGDFERHLQEIKECGYEGAELLIRDPREEDYEKLIRQVDQSGLKLAAAATSPMPSQDKLFLASDDKHVREEALRRGKELLKFCGLTGVPMVVGRFRGNINQQNPDNSMEALTETFYQLDEECELWGGRIALEVQNRNNVNTFNTSEEAAGWIRENGFRHIGLLLDTFHMELTERSFGEALSYGKGRIEFIHMSDIRRRVPGTGTIPFKEILSLLELSGYNGWCSAEVKQWPDSMTAARLTAEYLKYIEKLNF